MTRSDKHHPIRPVSPDRSNLFRRGHRLGKYKIIRRLGEGGFARVYAAQDTIEGVRVALKVPYGSLLTREVLDSFRAEVRLAARLDHPNILSLKTADFINGHFVAVTALGEETLGERLTRRLATAKALNFAEQALAAVSFAHDQGVIHCDIKPENFILFNGNEVRLTDFGIAKIAMQTVHASGSGTVGYVAPEQAMGKPSRRSDVFSLGLVIYKTLSGCLPEWPFDWPPRGHRRLRRKVGDPTLKVLERALAIDPRRRFADGNAMLLAFQRARRRSASSARRKRTVRSPNPSRPAWQSVQKREFKRRFGKQLEPRYSCTRCKGPVSEPMTHCPWCGTDRKSHRSETTFPVHCPRCNRGMKLDWRFCPWCYGSGFESDGNREYSDRRYQSKCANRACDRKDLMLFMRYCPWCHQKVRKPWRLAGTREACPKCHWGIASEFWSFCPWCGRPVRKP